MTWYAGADCQSHCMLAIKGMTDDCLPLCRYHGDLKSLLELRLSNMTTSAPRRVCTDVSVNLQVSGVNILNVFSTLWHHAHATDFSSLTQTLFVTRCCDIVTRSTDTRPFRRPPSLESETSLRWCLVYSGGSFCVVGPDNLRVLSDAANNISHTTALIANSSF